MASLRTFCLRVILNRAGDVGIRQCSPAWGSVRQCGAVVVSVRQRVVTIDERLPVVAHFNRQLCRITVLPDEMDLV